MAEIRYPTELTGAQWEKLAGKGAKDQGLGDALKQLQKLHDALEQGLFELAALKGADELDKRAGQLEAAAAKGVKALATQARSVAALAKKVEADFKRNAPPAKTGTAAAAAVAKLAEGHAGQIEKACEAAQAALKTRLAAAQAESKKGAAPAADEDALAQLRSRVLGALRTVKADAPGAKPIEFMVGVGAQQCQAFLGPSVGASHKTLLTTLMPGDSGIKFHLGECRWENKAYTFVGDSLPSGIAKRLQKSLRELTGSNLPLRVRKTTGEAEEAAGDDDMAGAATTTATATATATTTAARPAPAAVPAARPPATPAAAPAASAAAGRPAALAAWQSARSAAMGRLAKLAAAIKASGHPEADRSLIEVKAILANLSASPDTPQRVAELVRYLEDDDVLADVDSPNRFGIEVDLREPLLDALDDISATFA